MECLKNGKTIKMDFNKTFKLNFFLLWFLFFTSCSDSNKNCSENCKIQLSGKVVDQITKTPIEEVEFRISSFYIYRDPKYLSIKKFTAHNGNFDTEFNFDMETIVSVTNTSETGYYYTSTKLFLDKYNFFEEIELCPQSIVKFDLTKTTDADSLVFRVDGNQCNDVNKSIGYYQTRNITADSTNISKFFKLPVTSDLQIKVTGFKEEILLSDTIIILDTHRLDTIEMSIEY